MSANGSYWRKLSDMLYKIIKIKIKHSKLTEIVPQKALGIPTVPLVGGILYAHAHEGERPRG